jgi:flagellar motor protein MotB
MVYDRETMQLLKSEYELADLNSGKIVSSGFTDTHGSFLVCLPAGFNYGLHVSKPGYLFYSDNFMLEGVHTAATPFNKKILLSPVKVGEVLQLSNIFYEVDSWELKKESVSELDRLYRLLKDNPDIIVEVAGYTDSTGTAAYNQALSEKRSRAVVTWLTNKGIEGNRLKPRGYGSASPVGNNITAEGRKLNRRTEVRVTGKK